MADSVNPTQVTLSVDMMSVTENSGKEIKYTFTRKNSQDGESVDTNSELEVNFSIAGKAQLDTDYKLAGAVMNSTEYTVTIPTGQETATVTITPNADTEIESDEPVKFTLEEGENYIIGDDNSQSLEVAKLAASEGSSMDEDLTKMAVITNDDPMFDAPWAKQFNGSAYGYEFIAVDDQGNTYVTGDFDRETTLDDETITRNSNLGVYDVFVAKLDEDGKVLWAEEFGGDKDENVEDITVDDEGNTYITGTIEQSEGGNVFVNKYNKDGNSLWNKNFGDNSSNLEASGIEVDAEGNTYFTGDFSSQVTFSTTPDGTTLDAGQSRDVFVAKLDSKGDLLWAKDFGGDSEFDEAEDVVVDKEGNAYLFITENAESGQENASVIKLDKSDGSKLWTKTFGDANHYVVAEDIAIDNTGNTYITGDFKETVTFGNIPTTPTLDGGENGDAYLAKLDTKGDVLWVKDFDSQNNDENDVEVESITLDDMSNTYVTGYYESESMSVGDFMLYSEGGEGENAFITKFDSNGEVKWAQNLGGINTDTISDIAVNDGKIYIAGEFFKEATFADQTLSDNSNHRFIVKLEEAEKDKPEVSLSVDSNEITEGSSNQITYTFTRKGDFTSELTVDFSVSGSATFKDDYTVIGADDGFDGSKGKVTFKAGEETATVTLNIVDDSDVEEDENLGLELAMASGYMLSETEAKADITITKDEKDVVIGSGNDDDDDDDDDTEFTLTSKAKQTFKFKSKFKKGKSSIKFSFKSKSINEFKEIAVVTVDDDEGTIDGISPDSEAYLEAALNRSKSIFSLLGNTPQGFGDIDIEKVLEFSSETRFRFLSVKGGTLQGVKKGKIKKSQITLSSSDFLQVSESEKNSFDLDFEGVKIKMKFDAKAKKAVGSGLQETIEVLDFRDVSIKQKATFTVNREAAFDNVIGFYQVANTEGGIDTDGDGTADILVGDAGYAEAAVQNRITSIDLSVENQSTANFTGEFEAGVIVVPFLIVDGTPDAFTDVFFPFLGANSDGADHVMMLGPNTFGFEDLTGGGDRDFNDILVKIDFADGVST